MIKDILNKYLCIKCNYHTYQWFGKCPSCGTWDSIQESKQLTKSNKNIVTQAVKLQDIQDKQLSKYKTQIHEFDNMMNGGIIPSSLILIGGPPGVGKSTLMLHIASNLGHIGTVLYISGEESALQIKSRSKRIKITETNIFILSETNINNIIVNIQTIRPCFV
ncbi:MAG: DNA repair protein RadA, partial [Endomicrobium sp.]|nr:DNA repair protein RadA [Endomicrobium sp.]